MVVVLRHLQVLHDQAPQRDLHRALVVLGPVEGHREVRVEIGIPRGEPVECPAHALPVSEQLLDGRPGHHDQVDVPRAQVGKGALIIVSPE